METPFDIIGNYIGGGLRFLIFRFLGYKRGFDYFTTGSTQEKYNSLVAILAILLLGTLIVYIRN